MILNEKLFFLFSDIKRPNVMEKERAPCAPIKQFKEDNKNLLDETNPGSETSLRHFFYLEYRKV